MDNKTVIAVVLSILVLLGFNYFEMKQQKTRQLAMQQQAAQNAVSAAAPAANAPSAPAPSIPGGQAQATVTPAAEKTITVDTDLYTAKFSSIGGVPVSWTLKKYKGSTKETANKEVSLINESGSPAPLAIGWGGDFKGGQLNFAVAGGNLKLDKANPQGSVTFDYSFGGINIRRTYTFKAGVYTVGLTDQVIGVPDYTITLGPAFGIYQAEPRTHTGPVILYDTTRKDIYAKNVEKGSITYTSDVKWIAQEDKYFCAALIPLYNSPVASASLINGKPVMSLTSGPAAAGPIIRNFTLYAGPKADRQLNAAGHELNSIVDFGIFSIIARPIFWLLKRIYSFTGNYGWAIIVLTIIIRIPFIPLVMKAQKSMAKMQAIQPRMNEIRQKYKKDPQRMQKEMMDLYKKHQVNPMGGCLPMLIQIPVFFALYKVLLVAIELRGAPFALWITDLSQHDPYYVLPIFMGATMFLQQKMTPTGGDPTQRKMMMFMPLIFTVMFFKLASGLTLYWSVSNALSIAQQFYVNKKLGVRFIPDTQPR
ncbi:MAG: membrane protein insertase YidC [Nitrospiraceae bacterium]|nr:membrane protein insertase YidC [Nitrospiraceae bacterium]